MVGRAHAAITCPAGEGVEHTMYGPACRCRILKETITRDENSHTLQAYCAGDYRTCNVWQRMKEETEANRDHEFERQIASAAGKETGGLAVAIGGR